MELYYLNLQPLVVVLCRPREIFPDGTYLQMQEAEALWGAVSGSHWGAFVVGRALMSHLKAGVRLQQVQEKERGWRGRRTAGAGENRGEGVWALEKIGGDWETGDGGP